jgi:hypothetical protein
MAAVGDANFVLASWAATPDRAAVANADLPLMPCAKPSMRWPPMSANTFDGEPMPSQPRTLLTIPVTLLSSHDTNASQAPVMPFLIPDTMSEPIFSRSVAISPMAEITLPGIFDNHDAVSVQAVVNPVFTSLHAVLASESSLLPRSDRAETIFAGIPSKNDTKSETAGDYDDDGLDDVGDVGFDPIPHGAGD